MTLATAKTAAAFNYPLNEASGAALETIGGLDGTDINTVGSAAGLFGTARDFESANFERFTRADHANLSVADIDFCAVCWIKPESANPGSPRWIFAKGNTGTAALIPYAVNLDGSTRVRFIVGNGTSFTELTATTFGALSAGSAYLVVVKHDSANNVIGISINGGAYQTVACTHGSYNDTGSFAIGDLETAGQFPFDGLIEDLTLLKNYILDSSELTELWNSGTGVAFADWDAGGSSVLPLVACDMRNMSDMCGMRG